MRNKISNGINIYFNGGKVPKKYRKGVKSFLKQLKKNGKLLKKKKKKEEKEQKKRRREFAKFQKNSNNQEIY